MSWYYVENGEQRGPVEASAWTRLVEEGTVQATTLVWQEGMPNWQRYGDVATSQSGTAAAPVQVSPVPGTVCTRCGQAFSYSQLIRIEGANVCPNCKPLALQSLQEGVFNPDSNAEQLRKTHISHEASVKSVGILYFLGGSMLLILGLTSFLFGRSGRVEGAVLGGVFLALAALQICSGVGLRKLRPWARVSGGVLSGIGLLGFPLGTLINGYILYLLFSKKGSMVFSEPYQRVVAATPHIKYRTSIIVWILLGLLLLLIGVAIVAMVFGASRAR